MTISKIQLRKTIRAHRAKIDSTQRQTTALAATELFVHSALFDSANQIACYIATEQEFDTTPLIQAIWRAKKHCYLPVISSQQDSLHFVGYQENDPLYPNQYRILEPPIPAAGPIALETLDVVFVPLMAFDSHGHRLGSGGGFYDRTFAFLLSQSVKKPVLIGLGYQTQQVEQLPHDVWDVPLQGILTEEQFILF